MKNISWYSNSVNWGDTSDVIANVDNFLSAVINFWKAPSRITFKNLGNFQGRKGKYLWRSSSLVKLLPLQLAATLLMIPKLMILQTLTRETIVRRFLCGKGVPKNFALFTERHLCWSLFLIRLQGWSPATLLERDSNTGILLRNFLEQCF